MCKKLDFIIIGAQKSGTTSLFQYLSPHPQIHMPLGKEVSFFTPDEAYQRGWSRYAGEHFGRASSDKLWGKATPHYMMDSRVPARIKETMPDVKIIAILRNPIDRAWSHYKMTVGRGFDDQPFADAVEMLLKDAAQRDARLRYGQPADEKHGYLAWGEYGRILNAYLSLFPRERVLVLFTEDMAADPQGVYRGVLSFLGVDAEFQPGNLGKRYLDSADKGLARMTGVVRGFRPALALWRRMPETWRASLKFRLNLWTPSPVSANQKMEASLRDRLIDYYRQDVERLARLIDQPVPWPEFNRQDKPHRR